MKGIEANLNWVDLIRESEAGRQKVVMTLVNDAELKRKLISYVTRNSGAPSDAEMVFNDMILVFVKTAFKNRNFELTTGVHNYLLAVGKNIWMNELRKTKKNKTRDLEGVNIALDELNQEELIMKGERGKMLEKVLTILSKNCKEVLMHWSAGFSMKEISSKLNYKSEGMARKKKSNCMKELFAYLSKHTHIKERLKPY